MTETTEITEKKADFARRLGVKRPYVSKLVREGRVICCPDGRIKVQESLALIAETENPGYDHMRKHHAEQRAAKENGETPENNGSYTQSRALKEHYQALHAKLDYDLAAGEVVERASVERAAEDAGAALRAILENMSDQLAPALATARDEVATRHLIDEHVEMMLAQISNEFKKMAGPA
jgi:hypothetical protein